MKGISISEVLMYIIAVVIIVGLTFYFAFFLNVSASASMASENYLLFLNSLYLNRINYCTYLATNDSNYLFYFVRDMNISNIKELPDYIKNCFSRVIENVNILKGNYSVNSDEDLKRLSEEICGYDSDNFKNIIKNEYENCIILIYQTKEMSTVPIFAYINTSSNNVSWILEPAKALLEQEKTSEYTEDWNKKVLMVLFPPGYLLYRWVQEYHENQLIQSLEKNAESLVSCTADRSYSIVPAFALQSLVVDTNRNLYVLSVMQFSKTKNLGERVVVVNLTSRNVTGDFDIGKLKGYCSQEEIPIISGP